MIDFDDVLIKFILNETFGADSFEPAGDVHLFNNGLNAHGSVTRNESGWIVRYNTATVEIIVTQDGGEADDLITALSRADALADSAIMIVGRLADRGWEAVNHLDGAVCRLYKGGDSVTLYQKDSRSQPFTARGSRAGVNDAVLAGRGMVDWR